MGHYWALLPVAKTVFGPIPTPGATLQKLKIDMRRLGVPRSGPLDFSIRLNTGSGIEMRSYRGSSIGA